ncbi:beta-ketoacyl synthase chain length factor [Kosakonia oryzendophytica]|uniref:beta-ketoacyl synthase chain length factor n=1 Tax=Kosakonia oryzendophytica TaxID=1005665 RepID=UPI003D358CB7
MKFALKITDWQARAPGLSEAAQWREWSQNRDAIDPALPQAKLTALPMMTARRLSSGSRLAVECGITLLRQHQVEAVVFTSRHGELERNFRILQALATGQDLSPTDFAMSVHNSAVGNLTIAAQQPIVSSSLSAGLDTFQQGLCEVICFLQAGYQRVLMVDFDGALPAFYHPGLHPDMPTWAYAVALVFEAGEDLQCTSEAAICEGEPRLPQSVQFLQHYLRDAREFTIPGERLNWRWSRT